VNDPLRWFAARYRQLREVAQRLLVRLPLLSCWSAALTAAFFALVVVPWQPALIRVGGDESWMAVMHHAHLRNLQFGSDIVWTYGPLGFVLTNTFDPDTYKALIGVQLACVLSGALVLDRLRARHIQDWRLGLLWILALPFLSQHLDIPFDLVLLFVAAHVSARDGRRGPAQLFLAAVLGMMSLAKFPSLVASALVLALTAVEDVCRWRRVPWCFAVYVLSLLATWLALAQDLAGLPRYLQVSLELTRGYTDAMSLPGSRGTAALYIAAIGLLAAPLAAAAWRAQGKWALLSVAMFASAALVVFKAAFVRSDQHAAIGLHEALLASLLFLPVLWSAGAGLRMRGLLLASFLPPLFSGYRPPVFPATLPQTAATIADNLCWLTSPRRGYWTLAADHAAALATIADTHPFPEPAGSVDIYSFDQVQLLVHPWDYRPRPVIQSYSAYTPSLLRLNADHLRGADAPATVFFRLREIDGRWPAQMDSLSWPELLSRYEPDGSYGFAGNTLRLDKREQPCAVEWIPRESRTGRIGEVITLPESHGKLIWVRVHLHPRIARRVLSLVYKPCLVEIEVNEAGPRRLVPAIAESGFLLSPVVQNASGFRDLFDSPGTLPDATRVRVDAASLEFEPEFLLELMELRISR
jgi:hypothetical protein